METINNLASKAANAVSGNSKASTDENVPRSMPENDTIGGSSKPNYDGNYSSPFPNSHSTTNTI
jgi:hypothetical protein